MNALKAQNKKPKPIRSPDGKLASPGLRQAEIMHRYHHTRSMADELLRISKKNTVVLDMKSDKVEYSVLMEINTRIDYLKNNLDDDQDRTNFEMSWALFKRFLTLNKISKTPMIGVSDEGFIVAEWRNESPESIASLAFLEEDIIQFVLLQFAPYKKLTLDATYTEFKDDALFQSILGSLL